MSFCWFCHAPAQVDIVILFSPEIAEGNQELALERHDSLTQLSLSCLATMVNIPLEVDTGAAGRRKVDD